ncbi:MAG: tetratricopeptide repeat protein [Verrucomicrobiota bacterium]
MTRTLSIEELFTQAYEWQSSGQFYRAGQAYAEYLNHRGEDPSAWNNLGNCYRSLGCEDQSIPCFDRALELEPGRPSSRLNRGLAHLALGNYEKGWQDYEARLETISYKKEIVAQRHGQWTGETLRDESVLYLFGNQGLGDALQVWRYLPEVAKRAPEVILELQAPLTSLTKSLPPNVRVIERGEPVGRAHRWCELFSLPGIFQTEVDSIPKPQGIGYERNEEVLQRIEKERRRHRSSLHVGLVWSGTPANSLNTYRSLGLEELRPLLKLPHCHFHSLQVGDPAREADDLEESIRPVDLSPLLTDFAATATAVEALDLVITTDTSVPNLMGAMGRDAWVLLHRPCDWRWGRSGETTPWYPDLNLIRQAKMGDWDPVIEEVRSRLSALVSR